jgi:hypothetical protein
MSSEALRAMAAFLWTRSGGKCWSPRNPNNPRIVQLIEAGYLRRSDGRCGFERFKDSHVVWTDAARLAFADKNAGES